MPEIWTFTCGNWVCLGKIWAMSNTQLLFANFCHRTFCQSLHSFEQKKKGSRCNILSFHIKFLQERAFHLYKLSVPRQKFEQWQAPNPFLLPTCVTTQVTVNHSIAHHIESTILSQNLVPQHFTAFSNRIARQRQLCLSTSMTFMSVNHCIRL